MPICHDDDRFISDDTTEQAAAAAGCFGCPFIQECGELGLGEQWGVYGGMLVNDPVRKAHRRTVKRAETCRSGHPIEEYGVLVEAGGQIPVVDCRRCAAIKLHIAKAEPGTPMPETSSRPFDPIVHGTAKGYKQHWRRGSDACVPCALAHAESMVQRRQRQEAS